MADIYDIAKQALAKRAQNPFSDDRTLDLMLEIPKAVYAAKSDFEDSKLFAQNDIANNFYVTGERLLQTSSNPDGTLSNRAMDDYEMKMSNLRNEYVEKFPHAIEIIDSSLNHFQTIVGRERENNVMFDNIVSDVDALYAEDGTFANLLDSYSGYTEANILGKFGEGEEEGGKAHFFNELASTVKILDKFDSQLANKSRDFINRDGASRTKGLVDRGKKTLGVFSQQLLDVDELHGTDKILTDMERNAIETYIRDGDSTQLDGVIAANAAGLQQKTDDLYKVVSDNVNTYDSLVNLEAQHGNRDAIAKYQAGSTDEDVFFTLGVTRRDDGFGNLVNVPSDIITVPEYQYRKNNALKNIKGINSRIQGLNFAGHDYMDVKGNSDIGVKITRNEELAKEFDISYGDWTETKRKTEIPPDMKKKNLWSPSSIFESYFKGEDEKIDEREKPYFPKSETKFEKPPKGHPNYQEPIDADVGVPQLPGGLTYDSGPDALLDAGITDTEKPTPENNYATNIRNPLVDNKGIEAGQYSDYGDLHILNSGSDNIVNSFIDFVDNRGDWNNYNIPTIFKQFFEDNPQMATLKHGNSGFEGTASLDKDIEGEISPILKNIYNYKQNNQQGKMNQEIEQLNSIISYYDGSKEFHEGGPPENNTIFYQYLNDGAKVQIKEDKVVNYYDVYQNYPSKDNRESLVHAIYHLPGQSKTGKWMNPTDKSTWPSDDNIKEFLSQFGLTEQNISADTIRSLWRLKFQLNVHLKDGKETEASQIRIALDNIIKTLPTEYSIKKPKRKK